MRNYRSARRHRFPCGTGSDGTVEEFGVPATGAVSALIQALSDKSKKVRAAALEALKELGEAGSPR